MFCGNKRLYQGIDYILDYEDNYNAGTAYVVVKGIGEYSGTKYIPFKIKKASQKFRVTKYKSTTYYSYTRWSKQILSNPFYVTKHHGTLRFAKLSGTGRININKYGKIIVKKGTKPGTYKIKVRITANGDKNYRKTTKSVYITVKVKR